MAVVDELEFTAGGFLKNDHFPPVALTWMLAAVPEGQSLVSYDHAEEWPNTRIFQVGYGILTTFWFMTSDPFAIAGSQGPYWIEFPAQLWRFDPPIDVAQIGFHIRPGVEVTIQYGDDS